MLVWMALELTLQADAFMPNSYKPYSLIQHQATTAEDAAASLEKTASDSFLSEEIISKAQQEFEDEIQYGRTAFGGEASSSASRKWTDDDFLSQSVGVGNAGPQESSLQNGDTIFQTKEPVFSKEICETLVQEARDTITKELQERNDHNLQQAAAAGGSRTNCELGEARVSQLPKAREWLNTALQAELFPLLESRFGIPAESLALQDALIIGYGYFGAPTRAQPLHRDSCLLSLNVALSPSTDYTGGGTYFQGLEANVQNEQGHVLCHSSGSMHAGTSIQSGERWVLVLFVLSSQHPQLAQRCNAYGVRAKRLGQVDESYQAMQTSVQLAPHDFSFQTSLAGMEAERGNLHLSLRRLATAHFAYPICYKASQSLGTILFEQQNRPRAALRWLEYALNRIDGADLREGDVWMPLKAAGWNIRQNAAKCAIICATKNKAMAKQYLPKAIDWTRTCLEAAPEHPMLNGMLLTAENLDAELEE